MPKRGRDEGDAKLITSTVKVERIEEEKDRRERDIQIFVQKLEEDGVNPMWVMHFFSHGQNNLELAEEEEGCHWCQIGSWESDKRYPVCIINDVKGDRSRIDPNFRFIEENVVSDGVEFASEEFLSGCDCQEDNDCKKETCGCLQDLEHPEEGSEDTTPYDSNGCLKEWMVESRRPVYECHERCKCSSQCANRVVGQGRQVSLEIFRTDDGRGWGMVILISTS
jgi:histone-lysine N-methyltransferase SUV39H